MVKYIEDLTGVESGIAKGCCRCTDCIICVSVGSYT